MFFLHVLLLLLALVGLRTSGNLSILFREDTDNSSGYLVGNDGFYVNTKFLSSRYISQDQNMTITK